MFHLKTINMGIHLTRNWTCIGDTCFNCLLISFQVGTQTSFFNVESGSPSHSSRHKPRILSLIGVPYLSTTWWTFKEPVGIWGEGIFTAQGILEHLNVTKDISDYLSYTTRWMLSYMLFKKVCYISPDWEPSVHVFIN